MIPSIYICPQIDNQQASSKIKRPKVRCSNNLAYMPIWILSRLHSEARMSLEVMAEEPVLE